MSVAPVHPRTIFHIYRNQSNSDKARILDNSTCAGSPSTRRNNSDKSAPDFLASPVPLHIYLRPDLFPSDPSGQRTADSPLRTVGKGAPSFGSFLTLRILPPRGIFLFVHKSFLLPQSILR